MKASPIITIFTQTLTYNTSITLQMLCEMQQCGAILRWKMYTLTILWIAKPQYRIPPEIVTDQFQFQLTLLSIITILISIDHFINVKTTISLLQPSIPETALNSGKVTKPKKMANFDAQKSECEARRKKSFPESILTPTFCKKTGSKLVKFGLCGPISILHPPMGGHHPVRYRLYPVLTKLLFQSDCCVVVFQNGGRCGLEN